MTSNSTAPVKLLKVAVVGPCASGKTTLVEGLRDHGFDAWVTAQEHSAVPELWNHLAPDVLIALTIDLETIRHRRGEHWPSAVFKSQQERLQSAYHNAGLTLDSARHSADEVLASSIQYLQSLSTNVAQ